MSAKTFTAEEVALLAANPYTLKVTKGQISFTKEFKDLFWSEYQSGIGPVEIFRKYGYDPKILGRGRIDGFRYTLKKEAEAGLDFYSGHRPSGIRQEQITGKDPYEKTIREMQHRIDYLEQEIDFLKKISSVRNTRK